MSPILSDILTSEVVAELLACEPSTVEEAARNKELPAVKYGRGWVFPKEAFLAHINAKAKSNVCAHMHSPRKHAVHERPSVVIDESQGALVHYLRSG